MREIRLYGSEGGGAETNRSFPPLSPCIRGTISIGRITVGFLRGMQFARFPECVWPAAAVAVVNRPAAKIVTIDRASISSVARHSQFIVQNVIGQQLSQTGGSLANLALLLPEL